MCATGARLHHQEARFWGRGDDVGCRCDVNARRGATRTNTTSALVSTFCRHEVQQSRSSRAHTRLVVCSRVRAHSPFLNLLRVGRSRGALPTTTTTTRAMAVSSSVAAKITSAAAATTTIVTFLNVRLAVCRRRQRCCVARRGSAASHSN